jgi:hypothetical protein
MNPKSLSGFESTAVRGKWFEVNDINPNSTLYHHIVKLMSMVYPYYTTPTGNLDGN